MLLPNKKPKPLPCVVPGCKNKVWRANPDTCDECIWDLWVAFHIEMGTDPGPVFTWIGAPEPPGPVVWG